MELALNLNGQLLVRVGISNPHCVPVTGEVFLEARGFSEEPTSGIDE